MTEPAVMEVLDMTYKVLVISIIMSLLSLCYVNDIFNTSYINNMVISISMIK